MNDPQPPAPDDTDWEAEDESYVWHQWEFALDWAHKGDYRPLAELLGGDLPLNNRSVRDWLADGLVRGLKKPLKVKKRPDYVSFEMDGKHFHIDKRDLKRFEAMRRVKELQAGGIGKEAAIDRVASEHGIEDAETLKRWLDRTREHWGLSPARYDHMFDGVKIEK